MSFKICVIGCGEIANGNHGPAYHRYAQMNPDVVLAACCDRNTERAVQFSHRFNFERYYNDFEEMIRAEKPDAVCLHVPPNLTFQISCEILQKGIPLLLEKPPGLTSEETRQMIAIAGKTETPNQVAFNRRYTPLVRLLKQSLIELQLNPEDIQHLQYDLIRVDRTDADFSTTAIHGIDTARFIAGSDYDHIRFDYQEFPSLGSGVANVYMECTFQSGASAQLAFCPVSGVTTERAAVHLHDHTFFLNLPVWNAFDTPGRLMHFTKDKLVQDVSGEDISGGRDDYLLNGFYAEDEAFFNDVRNGRSPIANLASALQSVEVAQHLRERALEYSN